MSLSPYYTDIEWYLQDVTEFLNEFKWIYTTSNTKFIVCGTLRQIPSEWTHTIESLTLKELNEIPFDYIKESWPISLRTFLTRLKKLKPLKNDELVCSERKEKNEMKLLIGIKPKKNHEIHEFSKEISRNWGSVPNDSTIFIDLGCGVGHLTQFLHRQFSHRTLGIEGDLQRVQTATNIQKTKFPESRGSVKFAQHFIESDSQHFIESTLVKEFNLNEVPHLTLIGLHACADLTVSSLQLFLTTPMAQRLLIMPCCYHKMKYKENSPTDEFHNIPLSERVKSTRHINAIVNRPFLRLAGQQTAMRWRCNSEVEHLQHGRNMFVRGVVKAILNEDELVIKNRKIDSSHDSLTEESHEILSEYTLIDLHSRKEKAWSASHNLSLRNLLAEYQNGGILSEFLVCLQASIQSICENLVNLDRLLYVKEEAARRQLHVNVSVKKIVNEAISPRCFAIVAEKSREFMDVTQTKE